MIVDACNDRGLAFADWCITDACDAVFGHLELVDREAVLRLVQQLAKLQTPIEIDIVPPIQRGPWTIKLRAGQPAGGVLGILDDA